MSIKASDARGLQAAIDRALAKERGFVPEPAKIMWLARTGMLAVKPIKSRDPQAFMDAIKKLQSVYPKLKIYIFEIEGI